MRYFLLFLTLFTLAACDSPLPTPIPTRALSAPTLAPSPEILPLIPEVDPAQTGGLGQSDPTAAALPAGAELPPLPVGTRDLASAFQTVQVTIASGILEGDLYTPSADLRVPGVILLAADRAAWLDFPLRLRDAGLTVLSITYNTGDPSAFASLVQTLIQVGTVDPTRIAVVAADSASRAALDGCGADALCDAAALLNPQEVTTDVVLRFNPRPLLIAAPASDTAAAEALRPAVSGDAFFLYIPGSFSGGQALALGTPGAQMIEWLLGRWTG